MAVYVEYPHFEGGNLAEWLERGNQGGKDGKKEVKPWVMQGIARQLLYGLLYLHDNGVIHKNIKPSNVLMHEDGRLVLADFELSKQNSLPEGRRNSQMEEVIPVEEVFSACLDASPGGSTSKRLTASATSQDCSQEEAVTPRSGTPGLHGSRGGANRGSSVCL